MAVDVGFVIAARPDAVDVGFAIAARPDAVDVGFAIAARPDAVDVGFASAASPDAVVEGLVGGAELSATFVFPVFAAAHGRLTVWSFSCVLLQVFSRDWDLPSPATQAKRSSLTLITLKTLNSCRIASLISVICFAINDHTVLIDFIQPPGKLKFFFCSS